MKFILFLCSFVSMLSASSQQGKLKQSMYRAILSRKDSNEIVFNIQPAMQNGRQIFYVINDVERIKVTDIKIIGDSLLFNMPVFESTFRTKINADGSLQGTWFKGTKNDPQQWPFVAYPNQSFRFTPSKTTTPNNLAGKWAVSFKNDDGTNEQAIATFKQVGNKLSGTFLTTTGDYRYLDGIVTQDSMKLSTFDGGHAYLFTAKIENATELSGGIYYFGPAGHQGWTAKKDANAILPQQEAPCALRKGETSINFSFPDLNGRTVSLNDAKFKDKVIIVEIMGSWCPNCMDETAFLSKYYKANKSRGIEVISLAYEYTTDVKRSTASLNKFKSKFAVDYPILITGVTAGDEKKTEQTLPQLTPIRSFPTTIIIDKKKNVREIQSVFYGPGTGKYYEDFVKDFDKTIDKLVGE